MLIVFTKYYLPLTQKINTAQKMKFPIKDFFIFYAVKVSMYMKLNSEHQIYNSKFLQQLSYSSTELLVSANTTPE